MAFVGHPNTKRSEVLHFTYSRTNPFSQAFHSHLQMPYLFFPHVFAFIQFSSNESFFSSSIIHLKLQILYNDFHNYFCVKSSFLSKFFIPFCVLMIYTDVLYTKHIWIPKSQWQNFIFESYFCYIDIANVSNCSHLPLSKPFTNALLGLEV